jgi:hypothetical protein
VGQRLRGRIGEHGPAFSARCLVLFAVPWTKQGDRIPGRLRILRCGLVPVLVVARTSARHDVAWMTNILRKKMTGEKIILRLTMGTGLGLYPDEVLDGCRFAARVAPGNVKFPTLFSTSAMTARAASLNASRSRGASDCFTTQKAIGLMSVPTTLNQDGWPRRRRAAPHEGVRDNSFEIVCPPVGRFERLLPIKFG